MDFVRNELEKMDWGELAQEQEQEAFEMGWEGQSEGW